MAKNQFLQLLEVKQEISPGTAQQATATARPPGQLSYLRDALPESAINLIGMMMETPRYAYSYQSNQSGGGFGPPVAGLYLPSDVKTCREYALCHINEISQNMPQEQRDGLQRQLELAGVENANFILADLPQSVMQSDPMAFLKIDPDSEAALAIAALSNVNGEVELPQEVCLKAFEAFKESFPAVALFAAIKLDQTKPENEAHLAEAVKQLKTIENPNYLVFSFIARRPYQSGEPGEDDPLNKYRDELNQLLTEWYPKLQQSPQTSGWAFDVVARSFREEKSPKRLVEFLDQELDRTKGQSNQQQSRYAMYGRYGGNQTQEIALPAYPPRELISFPASIYAQLAMPSPEETEDPFSGMNRNSYDSDSQIEVLPESQIAMAVATAKDPTLKVLLELKYFYLRDQKNQDPETKDPKQPVQPLSDSTKAAFGAQVTDAKSAIDQLFEVSKTNVDAWYLAAALAVSEKRWDDAATNLETMRSLPMTAATRRKIDGHLVALATQGLIGDLKNKQYAKVVRSAKSAALRLRRGNLSQEQRVALVSIFEILELKDEAEKMESRIAKAANSSGGGGGGAARAVASVDRITKLNAAGKTDAAARLLSQEFQGLARQALNLDTVNQNSYEFRQFKEKVQKLSLQKELFAQLDPGESGSARKLGVWALAHETFDKKSDALKIYAQLLEAYPQENAARLRYVLLGPEGDENSFAVQFLKVSKRHRGQFLTALLDGVGNDTLGAKDLLSLAQSLVDFKEGEDGDSIDDRSMASLLQILGSQMAINPDRYGSYLPGIYSKVSKQKSDSGKTRKHAREIKSLAKLQRALHDRVALGLTDSIVPGQAPNAFTALLASTEATGKPIDDQIVELALKTVYPPKKSRSARGQYYRSYGYSSSFGYQSGSGDLQVTKRTPVEFLARHYGFEETAQDQQIETIAKKLESLKADADAAELRNTYALCRAGDDEFASVVEKVIESAKGTSRRVDTDQWQAGLSTVVEVWKERKLQADISPFMIDYAARKLDERSGWATRNGVPYLDSELVVGYLKEFAEANDLAQVEDLLTRLRLKMLGSEEEQRELAKLVVDRKTIQKNQKKLRPTGTYFFIVQSLNSRKTFWLGLRESQRFPFANQFNSDQSRKVLELMEGFGDDEVDSMLEWLRQSKVLADLDDFDPLFSQKDDTNKSLWGSVLKNFRYRYNTKLKAVLVKQLAKKAAPTFGEELLLAFANAKPANIYQLLGSKLDAFSALPEERQRQLARFASEINAITVDQIGVKRMVRLPSSEESKAVKKICLALENKSVNAEVVRLMEAKRFKDLNVRDSDFRSWSANLLGSMSVENSEKLLDAVLKISEIGLDKKLTARSSYYQVPSKSRLLEDVITKDISTDSLKLMLAALESDDYTDLNFRGDLTSSVGEFLDSKFANAKEDLKTANETMSSPDRSVEAIKRLIVLLGKEFGDRELTALLPEIRQVCTPIKKAEAGALNDWLKSDESFNYPKIKHTFQLAFDCSRELRKQQKRRKKSKIPPVRPKKTSGRLKEILSFVGDDSVPLQSRSKVALDLADYDGLSGHGIATCCQVLAKACDAGQLFGKTSIEKFFKALTTTGNTPEIKEAKIAFAKSWARALVKNKGISYRPSNVSSCMKILALTDDKAETTNLLDKLPFAHSDSDESQISITSVELGYFAQAEKQCEKNWSGNRFLDLGRSVTGRFTKELESELPKFLERFKEDGSRYFAELYFASFENLNSTDGITTTRESRLANLADRFASIEFKVVRKRRLSLILLANSYANPSAIESPLAKAINDLSAEELFTDANPELKAKLIAAYFSNQIQLEKFEPVQTLWEQINDVLKTEYPDNIPWEANRALDDVKLIVGGSIYRLLREKTPQEITEILPALRDLNRPSLELALSPKITQVAYLMAGRPDDLALYWKEQDASDVANEEKPKKWPADFNGLVKDLESTYKNVKSNQLAAKKNFVSSAWRFAKSQQLSFGPKEFETGTLDPNRKKRNTRYGIERLAQRKLLELEDLLKLAPELAEIDSVNGEIWLQLARRQVQAEQYPAAAESFKKSIDQATDAMDKAKFNRRVEYADTLVKLERNQEARKLIESVPVKQLFKANKTIFEELEKTLGVKESDPE